MWVTTQEGHLVNLDRASGSSLRARPSRRSSNEIAASRSTRPTRSATWAHWQHRVGPRRWHAAPQSALSRVGSDDMSFPVEIERDGVRISGQCSVERGALTVTHVMYGSETTQVGNTPPEALARLLLGEIVTKAKAKGL